MRHTEIFPEVQEAPAHRLAKLPPGAVLTFKNGERGFLNWGISRVQKTALYDMYPDMCGCLNKTARAYTHCGIVMENGDVGHVYYPRAQRAVWDKFKGKTVQVRIPPDYHPAKSDVVVRRMQWAIDHKERYDIMDVFEFWLRWRFKLWMKGDSYRRAFLGNSMNYVCSTKVAKILSGPYDFLQGDHEQWSYYPANMAVTDKLETIGHYKVV
jgi:hypothetical protein